MIAYLCLTTCLFLFILGCYMVMEWQGALRWFGVFNIAMNASTITSILKELL